MIKLADGRGSLYQWDTGRQVECDAEQVHFSNHHYGTSIDVDVQNGKATIPNQLLTSATPLKAWAWVTDSSGEYTKEEQIFLVTKRNKPSDYVYTPAEIKTWQDLQNQIGDLNNLTTEHKDNLVNAINDAALGGGSGSVDSVNGKTGAVVLTAEDINYDNDNTVYELMSQWSVDLETVGNALVTLDKNSHTHSNKDTLDKLSVTDGKLQYNGSDVGLKGDKGADGKDGITPTIGANGNWYLDTTDTGKPSRGEKGDKGDPGSDANVTKANVITALGYTPEAVSAQVTTGTEITLADNTEYRLADVTTLTLAYPTGNFECWMSLTFAASGTITVTLPTGTKYLGSSPNFKNGETWEVSIKDGVMVAQKVGDGSMASIETVEDGTEVSY